MLEGDTTAKKSQAKGRGGEIELAKILNGAGYDVRPGLPVSYGQEPDLVGLPDIHVEVKRVERLQLQEAMAQAVRDSEKFNDGRPAVFHRRNRQPWLVTMRLDDWLEIYDKKERNDEP